jgi:hypothetical protein
MVRLRTTERLRSAVALQQQATGLPRHMPESTHFPVFPRYAAHCSAPYTQRKQPQWYRMLQL